MSPPLALLLVAFSLFPSDVTPCTIMGPEKMYTDLELMLDSENVVYGKDHQHFLPEPNSHNSSITHVYAILKKDKNIKIPYQIEIHDVWPMTSCSNTRIETGKEYLFMIKPTGQAGIFDLHERLLHSSAILATNSTLSDAVRICGLNNVLRPDGTDTGPNGADARPYPDLWERKWSALDAASADDENCKSGAGSWRTLAKDNWTSLLFLAILTSVSLR